jgi:hypothetical protein
MMKHKMFAAMFNMGIDTWVTVWITCYFPKKAANSRVYCEKIWFFAVVLLQFMSQQVMFWGCVFAMRKPQILLNRRWQEKLRTLYNTFLYTQIGIYLSVILIDLFALIPVGLGL